MPKLSMTDIIDIISKSGTPKATKIRQLKYREKYHPGTDFYKPLRDEMSACHKRGGTKGNLDNFVDGYPDKKRIEHYREIVGGYKKWWGKKSLKWFTPPTQQYMKEGFEVSVNPELGLEVDGKRHLIKLYFKPEPLSKNRVEIANQLMENTLRAKSRATDIMSVLDIRTSKLIPCGAPSKLLEAMLAAEMVYIAKIWPDL
jgi:hypothetical protein